MRTFRQKRVYFQQHRKNSLGSRKPLRDLRELVNGIVGVILGDVVQMIGLAGAVSGVVVAISRTVQGDGAGLVEHAQKLRE